MLKLALSILFHTQPATPVQPVCVSHADYGIGIIAVVCDKRLQRLTHFPSRTSLVYVETGTCAQPTQDPACDADAEPWTETSATGWTVTYVPRRGADADVIDYDRCDPLNLPCDNAGAEYVESHRSTVARQTEWR